MSLLMAETPGLQGLRASARSSYLPETQSSSLKPWRVIPEPSSGELWTPNPKAQRRTMKEGMWAFPGKLRHLQERLSRVKQNAWAPKSLGFVGFQAETEVALGGAGLRDSGPLLSQNPHARILNTNHYSKTSKFPNEAQLLEAAKPNRTLE